MKYSFDDIERYAASATIHFRAAESVPTLAARLAHESLGQAALYRVFEAWKAGWR